MLKKAFTILLLATTLIGAGEQRGIKELILRSNNVTTVIFNYGSICAPNKLSGVADMYWNGLGYMWEFGPLVAAKVKDEDGYDIKLVSDSFIRMGQGDYSPSGQKWGFLPSEGSYNENSDEIPNYLNPDSWPMHWNGEWSGPNGATFTIGNNEVWYKVDDFSNAEFNYFPNENDTTMRGLGVKIQASMYQIGGAFTNSLLVDYNLTYHGTKDIEEMFLGFHGDPHIGGASDYSDDKIGFFSAEDLDEYPQYPGAVNTIYMYDADSLGYGERTPSYFGIKFISTPAEKGMHSLIAPQYTNSDPNVPRNDALIYDWFNSGIDNNTINPESNGDYVINFSAPPFNPDTNNTFSARLVFFFAEDFEGLLRYADYLDKYGNWIEMYGNFPYAGMTEYSVELQDLPNEVSGIVNIKPNFTGSAPNVKGALEYSIDSGKNWYPVTNEFDISAGYEWNTEEYKDASEYLLRVIAYNPDDKSQWSNYHINSAFTINNTVNAQPELDVVSIDDNTYFSGPVSFKWSQKDVDNSSQTIKIEYSKDWEAEFTIVYEQELAAGAHQYEWDITNVPSMDNCYIKYTLSDGEKDSVIVESIHLNHYTAIYEGMDFTHVSGKATPTMRAEVVDQSLLTGNEYGLTFSVDESAGQKYYTLTNLSTSGELLTNHLIDPSVSSPVIEGFKLRVKDEITRLNHDKSGFFREELDSITYTRFTTIGSPKKDEAEDWIIVFNSMETYFDGTYKFPGDTAINLSGDPVVCPFSLTVLNPDEKATYRIVEYDHTKNGKWDVGENILLQPRGETGTATCYEFVTLENHDFPVNAGDTCFITTYKELTENDVFRFTTDNNYIVDIEEEGSVTEYSLEQNYPNPFNPVTTINYSIPEAGLVSLKVYNILGQEVARLVNQTKEAGQYNAAFDASHLASGIYIYRLEAGSFIQTRKMMLLK